MRTFLVFSGTALACFAAGFMAARGWSDGDSAADVVQPVASDDAKAPAVAEIDARQEVGTQALLALVAKPADLARDHAAYTALMGMDAKAFAEGANEFIARLKQMESGSDFARFGEAWMNRWLDLDRESALEFIKSAKLIEELGATGGSGWDALEIGTSKLGGVFRALARRELEWTGEYVALLKVEPKRDLAVYDFLQIAAELDPVRAKQYLDRFSEGVNRSAAMKGYTLGLAKVDARTAFELAAKEPAGPLRSELLHNTIRFAEIGNVREMLDRIEDAALRQELAYSALHGMWFRSRPDTVEWIKEETERVASARGTTRDPSSWVMAIHQTAEDANVPRIVEWAASGNSDAHREIFASLAGRWAGLDPAAARRWLGENAERLDAKSVEQMRNVFENLAYAEPAAIRQWVDTLPPGPLQDQARFQLALDSGKKGDLAEVQAVYAAMLPRDGEGKIARQVGELLANQDGSMAAEWAMRLPEGAARAAAIASVAAEWSRRDLPGLRGWVETMPEGSERDATMREYAAKVAYVDPQTGAACVEQIADPKLREQAAAEVFLCWRHEDPASSRAWLRNLGGMREAWRKQTLNVAQ